MKWLVKVLATVSIVSSFVVAQADQPGGAPALQYTVAVEPAPASRLAIRASLSGVSPNAEKVRWELPEGFAYVRLPEPLLGGDVEAFADGVSLNVERTGPYAWDVSTAGHTTIELRYTVPLTHREIDAVKQRDAYEYPYLATDHGMLVSATMFIAPAEMSPAEIRVQFSTPDGWSVLAPWREVGPDEFAPVDRESLQNDLIAIGAADSWNTQEIRIGDFVGAIAVAPGQDELVGAVAAPIRRIVESELELFGRPPTGRYLFLFGRPDVQGSSMAGSPKTNSMTLCVSPQLAPHAAEYLPHLIAHEFYHTWSSARFDTPDELRWVGEGFTDYYAYLVSARLGLISWDKFAETLAEKMQSCAENPKRGKLSLVDAGGEVFFQGGDAYDLVYDGGLLIAAWLDRTIRRADHADAKNATLDDLMRRFTNDPRWEKGRAAPAIADFLAVVEEFAGAEAAAKLNGFVTRPYGFDSVAEFAELGLAMRYEVTKAKLDLRANLDGTRIVDIDPRGGAYRVGVRPDDVLIEVNGQPVSGPGDVHRAWRMPIDDRILVKLRRGEEEVTIDQPVPDEKHFYVPAAPWREHK